MRQFCQQLRYFLTVLDISTVAGKSSKSRIVLTATTLLYVANVISGVLGWLKILLLIGASGQSRAESLLAELRTSVGASAVLEQLLGLLPFVLADGLLVRYFCHGLDFLLHFADMAVLQDME